MGGGTGSIIDPTTRSGRMCVGSQRLASPRLELAGTPLFVDLNPLFDQLGERR